VAAEPAGKQGKFWECHDRLFADRTKLSPEDLKQHARDLQLDIKRFDTDFASAADKKKSTGTWLRRKRGGIQGTPGIFINGRFVEGPEPDDVFARIIDEELTKRGAGVPSKAASN